MEKDTHVFRKGKSVKGASIIRGVYNAVDALNQAYPGEHYIVKEGRKDNSTVLTIVDRKALLYAGAKRAEIEVDPTKDYTSVDFNSYSNWTFLGSTGGAGHRTTFASELERIVQNEQ